MSVNEVAYPSPELFNSSNEIKKTIDELDDEYKEPFVLFLDGYKYTEIAYKMNISVITVKNRIFVIRKSLADILNKYL